MRKILVILAILSFSAVKAQQNLPVLGEGYQDTPLIPGTQWHVHDNRRPYPPVVKPGAFVSVPAPADAVVLFAVAPSRTVMESYSRMMPFEISPLDMMYAILPVLSGQGGFLFLTLH